MKIRVDFTLDILDEDLDKLKALAGGVRTLQEARDFFKMDAEDYLVGYLSDNGIPCLTVRRA